MFSHVLFLLSLVFFYIVWCILPRYFYTDFWSSCQPVSREVASLTEKLEIPCVSLLSIRNLDHLYEGFQQMETFCCRRLRYLLLWVLVFWKLRRLSGQPAEAKAQAYRYLLRGLLGHRKTILRPSTDGQSSKKACWLFQLSLSGPWIVPSTCSFFYSHQSRRMQSTAFFTLSSGCIRLQEWILLPYTPSAVFSAKVGALRLESQPASHGKEPLEVTHLKQLVERTDNLDWQSFAIRKLSYVRPRLLRLFQKFRIMSKTSHLVGLKSLNLCSSELKPFLLLSSMGLADRRAHASKCCLAGSVV